MRTKAVLEVYIFVELGGYKSIHQHLIRVTTLKSKSTVNTTMYLFVDKKTKDAILKNGTRSESLACQKTTQC